MPEDRAGYAEMRNKLTMPIAGGENEHTVYGFQEFLSAGAVDIAQPDIGSCGGISAARHIIAVAQSLGVRINPHVWGSAVAQAASLQVIAALPVAHHSIFATEPVLEYDRSRLRAMRSATCALAARPAALVRMNCRPSSFAGQNGCICLRSVRRSAPVRATHHLPRLHLRVLQA